MKLLYVQFFFCVSVCIEAAEPVSFMGIAAQSTPVNAGVVVPFIIPFGSSFDKKRSCSSAIDSDAKRVHAENVQPVQKEPLVAEKSAMALLSFDKKRIEKEKAQQVDEEVQWDGKVLFLENSSLFKRRQKNAQEVLCAQSMVVEESMQAPLDVNFITLIELIKAGELAQIKVIVASDNNVVKRSDSNGWTLLHWAVSTNNQKKIFCDEVMYYACDENIILYLINAGADVNKATEIKEEKAGRTGGNTPLSLAVHNKSVIAALHLLLNGANPHLRDGKGQRPLDLLEEYHIVSTIESQKAKIIAKKGKKDLAIEFGNSALWMLHSYELRDLFELLKRFTTIEQITHC